MPQPAWFNTATFYEQKAIECNLIKYLDRTDWTPESVAGYLESLEITPYENFVDSANRENVSPSQYFNVAEYLQAKADQLNAMNDGAGYQNKTDWNQQSVLQAFDAANLSAWDHFTVAGQFENVNPSNSFDIGAFWAAKLASLSNDYVGGYEGRQWTLEQMQDVFRDLNINAIENVPDNPGGGASLVSAVPADKQVSRGIFSPWGDVEPDELVEQQLEPGPEVIAASPVPTKYIGTVTGSESRSTFNAQDQITGGNARDELAISMEADFRGMNRDGFVRDIDTVNLADAANRDLTFNAKGVEGVDTWNVDGNVNLASLDQTGITINYDGVDTKNGIEVGFAQNVTNATNDSLTIGLNEVFVPGRANSQYGTDQPDQQVDFTAHGIERITLNSTGKDQNMLNLVDTPYLEDHICPAKG